MKKLCKKVRFLGPEFDLMLMILLCLCKKVKCLGPELDTDVVYMMNMLPETGN